MKKKQRLATTIVVVIILIGLLSAHFFMTFNWVGVLAGHAVLSVTNQKSVPIAANMILSKDIHTVGQQLEADGWHVIEDSGNYMYFEKEGYYRSVSVAKENTIGYSVFYVSDTYDKDAYDEEQERKKWTTQDKEK